MTDWFSFFFFFKQKTAYEMRISDWSSDVCSSDLLGVAVNSPALSPKRIAAASQEARVLDGRIPLDKIDWATLAFDLGRYGRDALGRLKKVQGSPNDDEIRKQSETALAARRECRHEPRGRATGRERGWRDGENW